MLRWVAVCVSILLAPRSTPPIPSPLVPYQPPPPTPHQLRGPTHELTLSTGEVLLGRLIQRNADLVIFEHPILGRLEIPAGEVRTLRPLHVDTSPLPEKKAAPLQTPPHVTPQAAEADVPPPAVTTPTTTTAPATPRWKSHFELGFSGTAGVTDDTNLRIALNTVFKQDTRSLTFDSSYFLSSSNSERSDNKFTAGLLSQWDVPASRWSYFAQGRYDFDEFQSWEHRVTAGGGVGYLLADVTDLDDAGQPIDVFALTGRLGFGGRKEFGSLNEVLQPEGIIGADLTWHISQRQRLSTQLTFFPDLDDSGEFRAVTKAQWWLKLDALEGLSFKLGLDFEHQSQTDPGVSPNDVTVYGTLVLDF